MFYILCFILYDISAHRLNLFVIIFENNKIKIFDFLKSFDQSISRLKKF